MLVTVQGKEFQIDPEILKVSPYFKSLIDWNDPGELELDNNVEQFEQLVSFLKGEDTDPGPLGEFYMCGKSQGIMSEFGNVLEWAPEPLQIDVVNGPMVNLCHNFDKSVYQKAVMYNQQNRSYTLSEPLNTMMCKQQNKNPDYYHITVERKEYLILFISFTINDSSRTRHFI